MTSTGTSKESQLAVWVVYQFKFKTILTSSVGRQLTDFPCWFLTEIYFGGSGGILQQPREGRNPAENS